MATLHECLVTLTQLLAPMIPFITEHVWQELVRHSDPNAKISVHLTDFPRADNSTIDPQLGEQVALTRRIVELGRSSRAESAIKIRQPLGRALIAASGWANLPQEMRLQIADELNVLALEDIANADGDLVDISIKANFKTLGAKFGGAVQVISKEIAASDAQELVKTLRNSGTTQIGIWEIALEDLVITEVPKSGWMVASHEGESVALDLTLTSELILAGDAREVIRFIQERRKTDGFQISDRISIQWNAKESIVNAIEGHLAHIQDETLTLTMVRELTLNFNDSELGLAMVIIKAL